VHDHIVFNKLFEECKNDKKPYFKVFMTLSSHEPFEVPMKTVIKGTDEAHRFLNSVFYTDKAIGEFINKMKTLKSWNNTLIIFVADHGVRLPDNIPAYHPDRYHIPMIWTGGVIKKDTVITGYGSQTDIPTSILSQLNLKTDEYKFGKDLFNKQSESFVFYDFNNGFGFLTDTTIQVFDNNQKKNIIEENMTSEKYFGKAYMQHLMNDFISK
ncbi:MAG: sulfatase-like hydrolase/transferase, partial [Bacteroidales bacterium]|nr:sulfatase-like hydrolase/transferase [Bacteroidales bacterium]